MKYLITTIMSILVMISSITANATCTTNSCNSIYVSLLFVRSSGDISVGTTGSETALDCTPYNNHYTTINMSENNGKALYATLLAAQIADKKVTIRIRNGSSNCEIRYVTMARQ